MEIAIGPRNAKSPYFDATVAAGVARFSVYNHMYLPMGYGDPEAEYRRLTDGVALWDVACQRQVELVGPDAGDLAQLLSARDLSGQQVGQGRYAPVCDHAGRLLNDPVVLRVDRDRWWFSIADGDLLWWARAIAAERALEVEVSEADVFPLAVQGPRAVDVLGALFGDWIRELRFFWARPAELDGIPLLVSRSGWSKQGGFELYLRDGTRGVELWDRVMAAGEPWGIGPGCPNPVERVESGLLSFRSDTDDACTPLEAGLEQYVSLDAGGDFIGRDALRAQAAAGVLRRLVGVWIDGPPIGPNQHPWPVSVSEDQVGAVRAAVRSYRFERNIGIALLQRRACAPGTELEIASESGARTGVVTELPFSVD